MIRSSSLFAALSLSAMALASCGAEKLGAENGEDSTSATEGTPFTTAELGRFNEPWAIEFAPGTPVLFVTEKSGSMKFLDTATGTMLEGLDEGRPLPPASCSGRSRILSPVVVKVCNTVPISPCDASAISAANIFACASARGDPRVPILTV